jgi:hypothetical protein
VPSCPIGVTCIPTAMLAAGFTNMERTVSLCLKAKGTP